MHSATRKIGNQIATEIQAEEQAGFPTVLVTTGVSPRENPALAQPHFVVSSLTEIEIPALDGSPRQRSA